MQAKTRIHHEGTKITKKNLLFLSFVHFVVPILLWFRQDRHEFLT